jgi:hypothetical protein
MHGRFLRLKVFSRGLVNEIIFSLVNNQMEEMMTWYVLVMFFLETEEVCRSEANGVLRDWSGKRGRSVHVPPIYE